jgi:mono/diheme cytochrome c family protein
MPRRALLAASVALATIAAGVASADTQSSERIARGKYLTDVGDCVACHTAPGGKPFAGGLAVETPFGNLVSPNLTPDQATGIGTWSDDEFVRAVREGIGPGGERIYPALPYPYFTHVTNEDVLAIRAYLATLPPVRNAVVSDQLPFPFNIRQSLIVWRTLYFEPGFWHNDPGKSAEWNRGGYLVEGLGHCGACHTPKTALGGDENSRHLYGNAIQRWWAPGLNADKRSGLGAWPVEQVVQYLKSGRNDWADASGPMAEVVTKSTSLMSDGDLHAIATYLKSVPGPDDESRAPVAAGDARMRAGEAIYVDQCSACHTPTGAGIPKLLPRLAGSPALQGQDATSAIRVVLVGARSVGTDEAPTASAMPRFDWKLNDEQVAAVTTYIRNAWGNAAPAVSAGDVNSLRKGLQRHAGE